MNRPIDRKSRSSKQDLLASEVAKFLEQLQRRHLHPADFALAIAARFPGLPFDTFASAVCILATDHERSRF